MSEPVYYKFLNGREATHVAGFKYALRRWQTPVAGKLVACQNGYHVLAAEQTAGEFIARDLFVAEVRGDLLDAGDKIVARECRIVEHLPGWNERTQRLFAADCAERVLPVFEKRCPDDDRPRKAIEAARAFANGEIDAAARDAAWAAAWAAAGAAEGDAAGDAAWDAAWAAAWAAACAAARDAARDAAWAAAGDAAGDAAWAAACAAAGDAAGDAAWDAAGDAAGDAAWAAAWAAAREWQSTLLLDYAHGRLA